MNNLHGSNAIFLVQLIHFSMGHDLHDFVALVVLQFIYPANLMIRLDGTATPGGRPLQLLPSATRVHHFRDKKHELLQVNQVFFF